MGIAGVELLEGGSVAREWDDLAWRASTMPFLMRPVVAAWWQHLGRGGLEIVTARTSAGDLVAVAPLHVRAVGPIELSRWAGHGLGVIGQPLVDPDLDENEAAAIVGALWEAASAPRRILHLSDGVATRTASEAFRLSDQWVTTIDRDEVPIINLEGMGSAEDVLGLPRRRKLRKNIRRINRLADERGGVEVRVVRELAALDAVWPQLVTVHDAAERANPRVHLLAGDRGRFSGQVVRSLMAQGRAAVIVVTVDGVARGFHVVLRSGQIGIAWLARFDPAAADVSPGHLMLQEAVTWATGEGLDRLDLQLGDDDYKLRWATGSYDTATTVVADPSWGQWAPRLVEGLDRLHAWRSRR